MEQLFDRSLLKIKKQRNCRDFSNYDFLHHYSGSLLLERIKDIKKNFKLGLELGAKTPDNIVQGLINTKIAKLLRLDLANYSTMYPAFIADEETLPIKENSFDIVISNLNLHHVNDVIGTLVQINLALKKDSPFIAAIFGNQTLSQLRTSLAHTESNLRSGISPRIFPFIQDLQLPDILSRAGFTLNVIDKEIFKVSYSNIYDLLRDIRHIGDSNILFKRDKSYLGKSFFEIANDYYLQEFSDSEHKLIADFEIVFMIGWSK